MMQFIRLALLVELNNPFRVVSLYFLAYNCTGIAGVHLHYVKIMNGGCWNMRHLMNYNQWFESRISFVITKTEKRKRKESSFERTNYSISICSVSHNVLCFVLFRFTVILSPFFLLYFSSFFFSFFFLPLFFLFVFRYSCSLKFCVLVQTYVFFISIAIIIIILVCFFTVFVYPLFSFFISLSVSFLLYLFIY